MNNSEKYLFDENIEKAELNKDIILERGKFTANGYTFTVKPIYLGEEDSYFGDLSFSPIPLIKDNEELTDKEKTKKMRSHIITLFSKQLEDLLKKQTQNNNKAINKNVIKITWNRILKRFNKKYYYIDETVYPLIKWLQKKVYYNDKLVTFYNLERKYNLSKDEIQKIVIYMHELSGF